MTSVKLGEAYYEFTIDDGKLTAGLNRAKTKAKGDATAIAQDLNKVGEGAEKAAVKTDRAADKITKSVDKTAKAARADSKAIADAFDKQADAAEKASRRIANADNVVNMAAAKRRREVLAQAGNSIGAQLGNVGSIAGGGGAIGGSIVAVEALSDLLQNMANAAGGAGDSAEGMGQDLIGMSRGAMIATVGLAAITTALIGARQAMSFADEIGDTADRIHVTTDALQEYRYAVAAAGGDAAGADQALEGFSETLGKAQQGLDRALRPFKALGFTEAQVKSFKTAGEALDAVRGKLGELSDAQRDAILSQFGLSGMKQLLSQAVAEQDKMIAKAHELGLVMDAELIRKGGELNDEFEALTKVVDVQLKSALISLGPILTTLAKMTADWAKMVNSNIQNIQAGGALMGRFGVGKTLQIESQFRDQGRKQGLMGDALTSYVQDQMIGYAGAFSLTQDDMKRFAGVDQPGIGGGGLEDVSGGGSKPSDQTDAFNRSAMSAAYNAQRDYLQTMLSIADDAKEQAKIRKAMLDNERVYADAMHAMQIEEIRDGVSSNKTAQIAKLNEAKATDDANRAVQERILIADMQIAADKQLLDAKTARVNAEIAMLEAQKSNLTDLDAIAALDKQILALKYGLRRDVLDNAAAAKGARITAATGETTTVGVSKTEADALNAQREAELEAIRVSAMKPIERYFHELESTGMAAERAAVDGLQTFNQELTNIIMNGGKGIDVFRAAMNRFLSGMINNSLMSLEKVGAQAIGGLFSGGGSGGGFLSNVGSLFGFGGARASGGDVQAGMAYKVGENGPEMFVPRVSGGIVANHAMGGGGQPIRIEVAVQSNNRMFDARVRQISGQAASVAAVQAVQASPGYGVQKQYLEG